MYFGNIKNLLKLFKAEYHDFRWHILLLGILSFVGGILEGFGITSIIPLFSFLYRSQEQTPDVISQFIEKFFVYFHLPYTLKFLLIFILALFVLKAVILFIASYISGHVSTTYEKRTRGELLSLTLKSDWMHLSIQKIGYLSQILTTDVSNSSALLNYLSLFLITTINLVIYILLVFNISSVIALLAVIFGVIIFFVIKPLLYKNRILSQEVSHLYKESSHFVDEVMMGSKAIKSMFLEKYVSERGYVYFNRVKSLIMRMVVATSITNALLQPLGMALIIAIFAYFYKTSSFNFASFAVIVYAINKVFANVQMAQVQLNKISMVVPYLSAIVKYKKEATVYQENEKIGNKKFSFLNKLEFKDVSFSYITDRGILDNVSFVIKKGDMIGVIGPSGSGKTTIADLILRLFKPDKGEVLLDGRSINEIGLSEWRTNIGYVSQDSLLINDTVENNIKFYNERISHADVVVASKTANIYEFIEQLPEKFNTIVGERGLKLSGGQRQRIVLARVLATKPCILLLDEATSSLDNESELAIQGAINKLKGTITVIAIAHRLSTVMAADKLIVIEKGRMIEQGAPDELLKNKESYLSRVYNLR